MPSDVYNQIIEKIIVKQESIIGPIAVDQAQLVKDLSINWADKAITIGGPPQATIDELVEQYRELFGQIAVETCKDAVDQLLKQLPADQRPLSLK